MTRTITAKPKNRGSYTFGLINFIALLMERDHVEKALELINIYFSKLTLVEKKMLALNIIEATKQYDIPANLLPDSYYDFLTSSESNDIF